jgi:hypothetical protein
LDGKSVEVGQHLSMRRIEAFIAAERAAAKLLEQPGGLPVCIPIVL